MNFPLIFIFGTLFFLIFTLSIILLKDRFKIQKVENDFYQLEDILTSAPDGYYYEETGKNSYTYASRRLCILLNIIEKNKSFKEIISIFNQETQDELLLAFKELKEKHTPFDINVSTQYTHQHFTISGRKLFPRKNKEIFIIWFKDTSQKTNLLIKEKRLYTHLLQQREILTQTLNALPFPLILQNENNQISFSNSTYNKETEDNTDIHWIELKLNLTNQDCAHTLKYGQDKTTEEGLNALLNESDRNLKMLLKELPHSVLLFDTTGKLTFFNSQTSKVWGLENYFLKKEPTFSEILDKIQEKGLLTQVKDFAQYKKMQLNTFLQLTKTHEDFLYLTNGKIIKRLMIPSSKGGILVLDEEKTNKNISI